MQITSLYRSSVSGNLRYAIHAFVNFNFIFFAILAADNTYMHNVEDKIDIKKKTNNLNKKISIKRLNLLKDRINYKDRIG